MNRSSRRAQSNVQKRCFEAGQHVEALWTDNRYYPATGSSVETERHQWTTEENRNINSFFAKWLNGDGLPGKGDIVVFSGPKSIDDSDMEESLSQDIQRKKECET